jgi:hypothetical protein
LVLSGKRIYGRFWFDPGFSHLLRHEVYVLDPVM